VNVDQFFMIRKNDICIFILSLLENYNYLIIFGIAIQAIKANNKLYD